MSDTKFYYVRHDVELGDATRECDCSKPCQKVVKAEDFNALVDRLQETQKYWDDEKRRYDVVDKAFRQVCDERDSLSSRLGAILNLPLSGTKDNPDPWDAGYDVCLETVRRLARGTAVENRVPETTATKDYADFRNESE